MKRIIPLLLALLLAAACVPTPKESDRGRKDTSAERFAYGFFERCVIE